LRPETSTAALEVAAAAVGVGDMYTHYARRHFVLPALQIWSAVTWKEIISSYKVIMYLLILQNCCAMVC
jgi:hypothetical protein